MTAPTWVDTHCHVYDDRTPGGADGAIANATAHDVNKVIVIGTDADTTGKALDIAARHDNVWATVGLHPHDAKLGFDTILPFVKGVDAAELRRKKVVAIGECGLDFFYDHSDRSVQRQVFAQQIALAKQLDLSLVIHTRDAWSDTFDVLDGEGMPNRVVFHCFSGDEAEAREAVSRGAWLSFSGIVTFNKADDIRRAAKYCPAEKLLTETDAPWLAPVPHRGKENEPAHVRLVGECLAEVRGESVAAVAETTVANAHAAFPGITR